MRVIVSGAIANKPWNGGETWVRLSWLRGFARLGCWTCLIEQIDPDACVDRNGTPTTFRKSTNLAYFRDVVEQCGLEGQAALVCTDGSDVYGATIKELREVTESADLLVNITGHLTIKPLFQNIKRKLYIDIDPGFTQFWHAAGVSGARLDGHDAFFTIAENIGRPDCPLPTSGVKWQAIRQPVVLEDWPVTPPPADFRFTTIASWRGTYGRVQYQGRTFGLKVHEFRKFMSLPDRTGLPFEIALDIHAGDGADLEALRANKWHIVDPRKLARDPYDFRRYVQQSSAEFSVAQGIYVETNSGWFSDRTIRYLASGRPALVQDTGFSTHYTRGEGLVPFRTLEEAEEGAARIHRDYAQHAHAAREIAAAHFDSKKVLSRLLQAVGASV